LLNYAVLSFDYFLAETLAPSPAKINVPTYIAQDTLYKQWRGFAPPGTCTLVPLAGTECASNKHDCHFIALCPTMRTPENVNWDLEVVYECMWSLLVTIDNHNAAITTSGQPRISKVIITGLATGVGGVSAEKCAEQMALAVKHYEEAVSNPKMWSRLEWSDIYVKASEVDETRNII
jgi:O-acetyl-ADP-ribose deacetylase (regulator of RNase III)